MKKILIVSIFILMISTSLQQVSAKKLDVNSSPNTGGLSNWPSCEFKIDFNENGSVKELSSIYGWEYQQNGDDITITLEDYTVTISNMEFKGGDEIIGFTWTVSDNITISELWIKHGQTEKKYDQNGFVTEDEKGISNIVFCGLEEVDNGDDDKDDDQDDDENDDENDDDLEGDGNLDDDEDDDDEVDSEEDNGDVEGNDDEVVVDDEDETVSEDNEEEQETTPEDEEVVEEELEDDGNVLGDSDEVIDEKEEDEAEDYELEGYGNVLGESDEAEKETIIPDMSDEARSIHLGLFFLILGLLTIVASKKEEELA